MKKNYNFNDFDLNKKNYYLDNNGIYFEIDKVADISILNDYNKLYYKKLDSKLYDFLFENKNFPYNSSYYKFLILDLEFIENNVKNKIISFIKDLIGEIEVLEIKNKSILFYFSQVDIDFNSILESVYYDFSVRIKTFESGKVNVQNKKAFIILLEAYISYCYQSSRLYTSNRELILDIVKVNYTKLHNLREIIMNKVFNDASIEKIIFSMFDNNLNVTKTSKDTYMHRNTIIYKLDLIKSETNLNIQNFKDAISMYWILIAK